jgi:nicotinamide-nucleotide amidase
MKAELLSVGDEVISGEIADTNAAWLSQRLSELGVDVVRHAAVGDVESDVEAAVRLAASRAHVVLVTGGLGPTEDDLTRHGLAAAAGVALELDEASLQSIEQRFYRFGRPMPPQNRIQAMIPAGASVLPNSEGTAPGFIVRVDGVPVAALPGVPHEMKAMFESHLAAFITALPVERHAIRVERIRCFGIPESLVNQTLKPWLARNANPLVGMTVSDGIITVKFRGTGHSEAEAAEAIRPVREEAEKLLASFVFGRGHATLEGAVADLLERHRKTLAVAESCTGGLVGHLLTNVAGISRFLLEDLVTYSNPSKVELLGVPEGMLAQYGAVSEEVAKAMAEGVRQRAKADIGLSTTGIAGPAGGTPEKPVGLVYVGLATEAGTRAERLQALGTREIIKDRAARNALNVLRLHLAQLGDWAAGANP